MEYQVALIKYQEALTEDQATLMEYQGAFSTNYVDA